MSGRQTVAIDHEARARLAWPHLVKRARAGGIPFTYSQIAARIGVHHRATIWFLGVIQSHLKRKGEPALQALAVYAKTGLPGGGYHGSAIIPEAHKRELQRVYAFAEKWPLVAPF